jgi:hypothetical protein
MAEVAKLGKWKMKLSLAHEQVCNLTHHQFYLMALVLIVIVESQEDQAASCICHGFQRTLHKTFQENHHRLENSREGFPKANTMS